MYDAVELHRNNIHKNVKSLCKQMDKPHLYILSKQVTNTSNVFMSKSFTHCIAQGITIVRQFFVKRVNDWSLWILLNYSG